MTKFPCSSPRHAALRCCTLLWLLGSTVPGAQAASLDSTAAARQRLNLTLFQNGLALVSEQRQVTLSAGDNTLRWHGIATQLQPDSVLLRPSTVAQTLQLREQTYRPAQLNAENLLKHHLGHEVTVIYSPAGQAERREKARLLALDGAPILQFADRIETQLSGRLAFPHLPDELNSEPLLELRVHSKTAGQHNVELSYLSAGLSWQADYVAELASDQRHMNFDAWATLRNDSGQHFTGAHIQLLAGDVAQNAAQPRAPKHLSAMAAPAVMAEDSQSISEQGFADHHLYTLPQPADLADQSSKQSLLWSARQLPVSLHYRLSGESARHQLMQGSEAQPIDILLSFNNRDPQLGQPLPSGKLRVYQRDASGQLQFIGASRLPATARDGAVKLRLGSAFDLNARRRQLDFKRLDSGNARLQIIETRQHIELHNAKHEAVTISVEERLPGDWQILESSLPYQKLNATLAGWQVTVPAGGKQSLEYRVRSTLAN